MKRLVLSLAAAIAGYVIGAFAGYFLVGWLSSNTHDRPVEAAMTAAFVYGPIGAILAFAVAMIRGRKR